MRVYATGKIPTTIYAGTEGSGVWKSVNDGLTWSQIASDLHSPTSAVGKAVLGAANYLTAAICGLTKDAPATACTPAVRALRAKI